MRFYLNNLSNRVYVEVAPQITETFDESLDSATVTLQANTISTAYAPNQYFYICDDNDNILHKMIIALDMVETYSSKPLRYRHTLTLTQNSRNLSKHTVRNTVFAQPMDEYKRGYTAINNSFNKGYTRADSEVIEWRVPKAKDGNDNIWLEGITLNENDRVFGDLAIELTIWGIYHNTTDNYAHIFKVTSLSDCGGNGNVRLQLLKNGNPTGQEFAVSDSILNTKFIINAFTTYIKNNPVGVYTISLVNPIFTRDYNVKYNSTCFVMQIKYSIQTYYYNCYDALDLLIKREQKMNSQYGLKPLFALPQSGELHDLLVGTIPPNFTFTASTMYECIADIFKLFDAIFTIDNNNVLGIEYLNEYGTANTSEVASSRSSHAEENYNRGLVNFYQDARVIERFPSGKGYASARSSGLGVPTSTNEFCILLPHKIEYIDKVEMLNPNINIYLTWVISGGDTTHGTSTLHYDDDVVLDLSHFVLESSIYGLLPSGDESTIDNENQNLIQANTTYYQKGDNKVQLGLTYQNGTVTAITNFNFPTIVLYAFYRFFGLKYWQGQSDYAGSAVPNKNNYYSDNYLRIKTAVTYMATVDGKLEIESINPKYNGEVFVDQSNGAVDLNKLGLNMYGLAQKLGEPTLTKTMQIVDFSNRIRKGQYIVVDGEKWIANVITHTILDGGKVQSVVNFVKNYNALSLFTRVNKEKRMSNISNDLISKSEILFGEYLYFSTEAIDNTIPKKTKMKIDQICYLFANSFKLNESETNHVDYAIINSYNDDNIPYNFNDNNNTKRTLNIAIPLVRYGAGNSICLESSFTHPKSAGNKTVGDYQWYGGTSYFTNFIPYTNENGFIDKIDYKIYSKVAETDLSEYPLIDTTSTDNVVIDLQQLVVKKFPNEILAINYQIHMLPLPTRKDIDFVGSAFINNNAIVKNATSKNFYIYMSNTYTYSLLDTKGVGTPHAITNVTKSSSGNTFNLTFTYGSTTTTNIKSWAICDENGNIYFASNTRPGSTSVTVYFASRNQRINDDVLEFYYGIKVIINQGIQSVRVTVTRNGTTIKNVVVTEDTLMDDLEEGDVYSWNATAKSGYGIDNWASHGAGTIDALITISPIPYPLPYTIDRTLPTGVASVVTQKNVQNTWVAFTGNTIYTDEVIKMTFTASNNYLITTENPKTITVSGNVAVADYVSASYIRHFKIKNGGNCVIQFSIKRNNAQIYGGLIPASREVDLEVIDGDTYEWTAYPNSGFYIDGNDEGSGTINGNDVNEGTITALAYRTITLNFTSGVHFISFTLDGTATSYYNPSPLESYTKVIENVRQGLAYSWDASPVLGWSITNDDTGSGNTSDGDVEVNVEAERNYFTLKIKAGGNSVITGTVVNDGVTTNVTLSAGQTYENTDMVYGSTYEFEANPTDSTFYFDSGETDSWSGTISDASVDLGTGPSAKRYRKITINWKAGVQLVSVTLDGTATSYYNPTPGSDYGEEDVETDIEQGLAYSYQASAITNYEIDSGGTGSGNTTDGDIYIEPTASRPEYAFSITAGGNVVVSGTVAGTNITLSAGQTYSTNVPKGMSYDLTVSARDSTFYLPSGSTTSYSGYVNAATALGTTDSALAYRTLTVNWSKGVQYVTFTLDGVTNSYYNPTPGSDYGAQVILDEIEQGLAWSIEAHPVNTYTIDSGTGSASGNTTNGNISLSPTASKPTYSFTIKAGGNVVVSGTVGSTNINLSANQTYTTTVEEGTAYDLTVNPRDSYFYLPSGSTTSYSGYVNSNTDLGTTASALAYRTMTINWGAGVLYVVVDGTSYYNPHPGTGGDTTVIKKEQGFGTISYSSHAANQWTITSYASGTWSDSGNITISPTAVHN